MSDAMYWANRAEEAEAKVARVEALVDQWDGELGAQEDYQPRAAVRAVEACLRDLRSALAERADDACTCPWVEPSLWTTYYGAIEPGSTREFDPDCVVHGYAAGRPMPDAGAAPALAGPEPEASPFEPGGSVYTAIDDLLASPKVGRCTACGRTTWDAASMGHQCLMTQPDGSRCPGVFEATEGGA
jgi:hypothetical protein